MKSVDGGKTWALAGPSGRAATLVESTANGSLYVFLAGAGLLKLSKEWNWTELANDFGEQCRTASKICTPNHKRYILHLAGDPDAAAHHLVAVTDESAVIESRDGGKTWQGFGR